MPYPKPRGVKTMISLIWVSMAGWLLMAQPTSATETEHLGFTIVPAPGAVTIDGRSDDWDLTQGIFALNDIEALREEYGVWFHAMYDDRYVYLLARWQDPTPLNNPGSSAGDLGFQGDSLQVRFITRYEVRGQEKVSHWTCWRDADGIDVVQLTYGRSFNEGDVRDAQENGARQEFTLVEGGDLAKGYVQEIAIPWSMLTHDGEPLKAGDQLVMTIEPNYTAGAMGRVSIKDIFRPDVKLDRVFAFQAYGQWGLATLAEPGRTDKPRLLRLSDGREFPVELEQGRPRVDWSALSRRTPQPGIKEITFTTPAQGFVSLNIYDEQGTVVRHLLTAHPMDAGEHTVTWDGLTTPWWRTPGNPVATGAYTWRAIWHPGIGLRLRGWASNAGHAPWDNGPTTNWGGDHGQPTAASADEHGIYLGWTGAEAGKALVATDLDGGVRWKHLRGGLGGAGMVAADGGFVYVLDHHKILYRVDSPAGGYARWEGKPSAELPISALWPQPAGMPDSASGMHARNGKVYLSFASVGFRRADITDWRKLIDLIATRPDHPWVQRIRPRLHEHWRGQLPGWDAEKTGLDDFAASPAYFVPDLRDDIVAALNAILNLPLGVEGAQELSGQPLQRANREAIEAGLPGCLVSITSNFVAVLDGQTGAVLKHVAVPTPGPIHAVSDTLVYVIGSGGQSIYAVNPETDSVTRVIAGLDQARGLTTDASGRLYVSLGGTTHQVRVFDKDGGHVADIGSQGGRPRLGPWQRRGLYNPTGIVIDSRNRLWVAEADEHPKRVSLWNAENGQFISEFFGPTHYGASGGAIHPLDPNIMAGDGCEWRLDPQTGRAECLGVFDTKYHNTAIYVRAGNGKIYLAAWSGAGIEIWQRLDEGKLVLRANIRSENNQTSFWADVNDDQQQQSDEVTVYPGALILGGYLFAGNINNDLSINASVSFDQPGLHFKPVSFTACEAPVYDVRNPGVLPRRFMSGLLSDDHAHLLEVQTGNDYVVRAYDMASGREMWRYPNLFAGVHGSHLAPPPEPGLLRGVFGAIGVATLPEPLGPIWVLNSNVGEWHVFTRDGFYLTRLFEGDPFKQKFPEHPAPGAVLDDSPPGLGGEDFGGSMRQAQDGQVYLQAGKTALWNILVKGLDQVQAIPGGSLQVSDQDIALASQFRDRLIQSAAGVKRHVARRGSVVFTGDLDHDFGHTERLAFRKQQGAEVRAALAWDDANLYLGYEVADSSPWINGADAPEFLYARGDSTDLQLGLNPDAPADRPEPGEGDLRLVIGPYQGKPTAVLYRKVSAVSKPRTFSSGVEADYEMQYVAVVEGCDIKVNVSDNRYTLEASIPLSALGLSIRPGLTLQGDLGVTHSDASGGDTLVRTCWSNQQTGLVNDEVFELKMQPANWGRITFEP